MTTEYPHIDSIYKRYIEGPNKGKFIFGQYSRPEFEYLKDNPWVWTEKVDGTNIRVIYNVSDDQDYGIPYVQYGGKTDNAQLPAKLLNYLKEALELDKLRTVFKQSEVVVNGPVVLYGEGHGAGIQKGGGNYSEDQRFVLFDVKIGRWWLKRDAVEDIAKKLEIPIVPIIDISTMSEAETLVKEGFYSTWGQFLAEGLVGRPQIDLLDRAGKRIITKVKHVDYK